MKSSDWSNGIRYHTFHIRSDTEFNTRVQGSNALEDVADNICQTLRNGQPGVMASEYRGSGLHVAADEEGGGGGGGGGGGAGPSGVKAGAYTRSLLSST